MTIVRWSQMVLLLAVTSGGVGCSDSKPASSSAAGTIAIESRTRVDADTADDIVSGTAIVSEDRVVSLPPNGIVAGYLSASEGIYQTGPDSSDEFRFFLDRKDTYAITLSKDDRISIQLFGSPDSYLRGLVGPPSTTFSIRAGSTTGELLTSTDISGYGSHIYATDGDGFEPGSYVVEIEANSGAPFRYVLTLSTSSGANDMNTAYVEPPFRPGEAIVTLAGSGAEEISAAASRTHGLSASARHLGGNAWHLKQDSVSAFSGDSQKDQRQATLAWIRELKSQPGVTLAEPNYEYYAQQILPDDDPLFARQWNYPLIQLPLAWQLAPGGGRGVGVAVMDTGLFTETPGTAANWHPDFVQTDGTSNARTISGQTMDFVSESLDIDSRFGDPAGRDNNPADPGDGKAQSSNFHGTHVAGIVAAADNTIGVVGVAPGARLYPVRVLGEEGVGSSADLVDAINWAANQDQIDVINLSLGGLANSSSLKQAIDNAWGRGKLIVAAAGNQGNDAATYPAAYSNVVGVGAVDGSGERASYSNVGSSVDLVAPGGDVTRDANQDGAADLVISTWGQDEGGEFEPVYAGLQGTSMATPHVSGLYALMKSQAEENGFSMGPGEFFAYMRDGQLTSPPPNRPEYGYGLIDAVKAINAALEGNVPVVLGAQPSVLQFTRAVLDQEVQLSVYPESASISDISITSSASWLVPGELDEVNLVLPVSASADGLGTAETRRAEIVISYLVDGSDNKSLTVPVTQQSGDAARDRNAGRHYVLLIPVDDDESEAIQQDIVVASNGEYRFRFDDVSPGEYFLVAGTDTDNNGFICENGEACAEYPVNGLPEPVVFDGRELSGLNMSTSFRRPTISAMGGPRYGFKGYPVKSTGQASQSETTVRRVE